MASTFAKVQAIRGVLMRYTLEDTMRADLNLFSRWRASKESFSPGRVTNPTLRGVVCAISVGPACNRPPSGFKSSADFLGQPAGAGAGNSLVPRIAAKG